MYQRTNYVPDHAGVSVVMNASNGGSLRNKQICYSVSVIMPPCTAYRWHTSLQVIRTRLLRFSGAHLKQCHTFKPIFYSCRRFCGVNRGYAIEMTGGSFSEVENMVPR
jgi:uncharacterized protein YmfQ (DUF2313 family)